MNSYAGGGYLLPSAPVRYVSSDPDGVLSAPRGTLVIDATTGVTWKNRSGGTIWDPAFIPPDMGTYYFDDFLTTTQTASTAIGGGSVGEANGESGLPGLRNLRATAAGVDAAQIALRVGSFLVGGGRARVRVSARIPTTLSDGTNNQTIRIGGGDAGTFADHTDGVYFESSYATNTDNIWRICSANNGTRTKTTTGIAAATSTGACTTFEIDINAAASSITGRIGGVTIPTPVTTNIPTGAGRNFAPINVINLKDLGAVARDLTIDYVEFWQIFTTAR